MTEQNWQCTSLCQACFPSLFIGVQLGTTDCRRHIEIHFTFSPTLAAIANALKCNSAWQREESFLSLFPYLSNSRTLLGGENGGPGLSEYTETVHWGSWSSLFRNPWTSIHNTHKQRFTINMQMMCFGNIICFQRVNSVICITLNFFIWTGLLDCHCSSAKKSWMDILDALINFLMLKTPQIQPC